MELPDDALVLRGGTMRMADLLRTAEHCVVKHGRPGVSVFAADVASLDELLAQCVVPHGHIRLSTVGRLRALGFTVEQTGPPPHHTVWLPAGDREHWLKVLERAFDEPIARPGF